MSPVGADPREITLARGLLVAFLLSFGPAVSNSFARFAYALILPAMRSDLHWSYSQAGSIIRSMSSPTALRVAMTVAASRAIGPLPQPWILNAG